MNFSCYKCNKSFVQKQHLINHLNRKKSCQLCNNGFETHYAYVNGESIHVNDYKKNGTPFCRLKHELVYVKGNEGRKSYFRHKNKGDIDDNKMSQFHIDWQKYFKSTEVWFPKKSEQLKDRRADIVLDNCNYIVEIQHSSIKPEEVRCRREDYRKHNKEIIWIIDGENTKVETLYTDGGGYLITFDKEWKYKSYDESYKHMCVLLDHYDINDKKHKIFKIQLDKVTTKMIKVCDYQSKDIVIDRLNTNPSNIWDLWKDNNFIIPKLTISQKGAGNGKTYETWKKVIENSDKDTFILLTPKHSEKDVILNELNDQINRKEFYLEENIDCVDEIMKKMEKKGGTESRASQYVLKYKHKISDRSVTVIIATVQSFYFNLTEINKNSSDPFSTLVPNFLEGVIGEKGPKINPRTGEFYFAKDYRFLNKKTQIDFDEAQDLEKEQLECMNRLMLRYGVDIGVVGDKLQSLKHEENLFTELNRLKDNTDINREVINPVNINRRIEVSGLAEEINKKIKYEENGVLPITIPKDKKKKLESVKVPFEVFKSKGIRAGSEDICLIDKYCSDIINMMKKEINANYYLPQDILIISPILSGRNELNELNSRIEEMWISFFDDKDYIKKIKDDSDNKDEWGGWKNENHDTKGKVIKYCSLHKSDNGSAINLKESRYKTRIVSTITSKGDGRNLVFVLNTTEATLKLVGDNKIGLKYESSFNVSLTRAKRKVYFELTENGDNIHKRFNGFGGNYICPYISKHITINKLNDNEIIKDKDISNILKIYGVDYIDENTESISGYDFTDHCSRYAVWKTILHFIINKRENGHTYRTYDNVFNLDIMPPELPGQYWKFIRTQDNESSPIDGIISIPILKYDHKIYEGFSKEIREKMINIKTKLKDAKFNDIQSMNLKLEDYLLISYMININRYKNKSPFPITELYNILSSLKTKTETGDFYGKILPLINKSDEMITEIENKYGKLQWITEKNICYDNTDLENHTFRKTPSFLIGNNDNYVIDVKLKTSFSELNYIETMKEILLERFIIYNPEQTKLKKDRDRYYGKKIITYLLILDGNKYVNFDWTWDKNNEDLKRIVNEGIINYYDQKNTELFYFMYNIIKRWGKGGEISSDNKWIENEDIEPLKDIINKEREESPIKKSIEYIREKIKLNYKDGKEQPEYIRNYIIYISKLSKKELYEKYTDDVIESKKYFMSKVRELLSDQIQIYKDEEDDDDEW